MNRWTPFLSLFLLFVFINTGLATAEETDEAGGKKTHLTFDEHTPQFDQLPFDIDESIASVPSQTTLNWFAMLP